MTARRGPPPRRAPGQGGKVVGITSANSNPTAVIVRCENCGQHFEQLRPYHRACRDCYGHRRVHAAIEFMRRAWEAGR